MTDERTATRIEAIRGLEIEFGELIARFRRIIAENAQLVSPGMLPGAYKVFTTIARRGPVTSAVLREQLLIDKGQLSRTVRELEQLGLIARGEDPDDRRSIILSPTEEGLRRLTAARETQAGGLMSLIDDWPIERIHLLAELLHDLAGRVGRRP